MKSLRYVLLLLAVSLAASFSAVAENSTSVGGFTVHYSAFVTSTLTPQVTKAYGIKRSKNLGMLNVSVIKEQKGTTGKSMPARVEVKTALLTGGSDRVPMREIKEGDAVYYIGTFRIRDREKIDFTIEVMPEGTDETFIVRMEQQFFTD